MRRQISPLPLPFLRWPPVVGRRSCLLESRRRSWSHTQPTDHRPLLGRRRTAPQSRPSGPQTWAEVDLKRSHAFIIFMRLAQLYSISSGYELVECSFKISRIRWWINQDEHLYRNLFSLSKSHWDYYKTMSILLLIPCCRVLGHASFPQVGEDFTLVK